MKIANKVAYGKDYNDELLHFLHSWKESVVKEAKRMSDKILGK